MKNVLYIGNALSKKGKTLTTIETLGANLSSFCNISIASDKRNKIVRLFDMVKLVVAKRKCTDFVLIDTYSTTNFYFAYVISQLCRFFSLKCINILHGGNLEERLKHNPKLCASIFKNATHLVAPSNYLKSVFENYGYNNVQFIPNSIEINSYQYKERQIKSINILWVRSFAQIYNPNLAVLVLEKLLDINYDATLTMIGPDVDGSFAKVKELAQKKNLKVEFTGKLTKPQWIEKSKNHNVFINTTNFDNTPVSVMEAMALGLPIVSTNVGGMPFLIEHNVDGLLVKPDNLEEMVEAILKFQKNESFKNQVVLNARNKVEKFSWDEVKPKWQALLS